MNPVLELFTALFFGLQSPPQATPPAIRQPQARHQLPAAKQRWQKVRFVMRLPVPKPRPTIEHEQVMRIKGVEIIWIGPYQVWPIHYTFVG